MSYLVSKNENFFTYHLTNNKKSLFNELNGYNFDSKETDFWGR